MKMIFLKMINYCVKLPFKNIVIDDFQYLITNFIFEHAEEKGYDKNTDEQLKAAMEKIQEKVQ